MNIIFTYVAEVSYHDMMLAFFSEMMLVGTLGIHLSKKLVLSDKMRSLTDNLTP